MSLAEITLHAIAMIEQLAQLIRDAHAGHVTPDEALERIGKLHAALEASRAEALKALDAKFDSPASER